MTKPVTNGLSLTLVFLAQSANYGEGLGNVATLKTLTRNNGHQYTYISRQALRYSLVQQLRWDTTPVIAQGKGEKQVVQFAPDATILDYPEIDLFGYMKTEKGSNGTKRSAVVRLSDAISLEPFSNDMDFLTNMGLAKRDEKASNSIAQSEQHRSYYSYTVTADLERVGVDGDLVLSSEEKAARVEALLEGLEFLGREIKGRDESLNPVFVIGGLYRRKNPFFKDRVHLKRNNLLVEPLVQIKNSYDWISSQTHVGVMACQFDNDEEIVETLGALQVSDVFKQLRREVRDYYGV